RRTWTLRAGLGDGNAVSRNLPQVGMHDRNPSGSRDRERRHGGRCGENAGGAMGETLSWQTIDELLVKMEELQSRKVLELARRLKPGLTLEDVRNPHDFPELSDPDWHYADGVLSGIQSVASALRALKSG